jgi:hypothetical protein
MNLRPISILATIALSSIALSAQTPAVSPALYAASAAPAAFSSSIAPDMFVAAASAPSSATAAPSKGSSSPFSGLAAGVSVGFGGIGFDVATPLIPQRINLRGGGAFFNYSNSGTYGSNSTSTGYVINGTLKFQSADAMVDWFPFHGSFRLSAGMTMYNNTNVTASATIPAGQSIKLNSVTYYSDPASPLTGSGFLTIGGKTAPRTTIGFGNMLPKNGHFRFESEIGVEYISAPTVTFNNFTGEGCTSDVNGAYSGCTQITSTNTAVWSNVIAEQNKLNNSLNVLHYFPILSFELSYKIH